jgi:protein-S-isoprenylcysteine O-methyltransferase Ste14
MRLMVLIGEGRRIMCLTLPFAAVLIVANVLSPGWFTLGFGTGGVVAGVVLLAAGVPTWLWSVALVLLRVPQKKLITTGPFAIMLHPLYTSVALLVLPGLGLLFFDSWVGAGIGAILYVSSRLFAPGEEVILRKVFGADYEAYRRKVLLPWL